MEGHGGMQTDIVLEGWQRVLYLDPTGNRSATTYITIEVSYRVRNQAGGDNFQGKQKCTFVQSHGGDGMVGLKEEDGWVREAIQGMKTNANSH